MDPGIGPPSESPADTEVPSAVVLMIDGTGVVTGCGGDARRFLGRGVEQVVGVRADDLLVPESGPPLSSALAERHEWSGSVSTRYKDGRLLRLWALGFRCADHGEPAEWVLVASLAGHFLASDTERAVLDWLFAHSPVAMAVFDTDLKCVRQNAAMTRLSGLSEAGRQGKRLPEVLAGSDAMAWEKCMGRVLETGEPAFDHEIHGRFLGDPDQERVFSAAATALRDPRGRKVGLCTTVTDVTDQFRARERLVLLNEASTRIGSTLDVMRTAQELADVAAPRLADLVTVDLLESLLLGDEPGPFTGAVALRRAANQSVREGAPEAVRLAGAVDFYPSHSPPVRCMATGRSFLHRSTDDPVKAWLADDPARAERFRTYGFRSAMGVPMRARGTTLGITIFYRSNRAPFTDDDRLLAEELVARAAVCLDNARRFTRERAAALALQQRLLPQGTPPQPAVETASRYLPAGGQSGLGGDWFDVIPLSGARVALVVGDVVGHGITAAATMGRLRTAVHTLADVDLPPDELLTHLDDVVVRLAAENSDSPGDGILGATCLYAVYDPISRTCQLARAGHPPPVLVSPGGKAQLVDLPESPPLGLGDIPFEAAEVRIPEGSILAFYTDGLINLRNRDLDGVLGQLGDALAAPAVSLNALCDRVLDELLPEHPTDDAALLVARTKGLGADQVAELDIPADPAAVASARSWAVRQLALWELTEAAFVTELVVSELVTNAIRYAEAPVQLRLIRDRTLICEVSDASGTAPHMRRARPSDEGGRGLLLVAQLTHRWGTRHARDGKTIWCEQLVADDGPAR